MNKTLTLLLLISSAVTFANTKCIAHRGYHADVPENSIQAMLEAERIGADGIEIDIMHTKDGHPIIMHDKVLKRTVEQKSSSICKVNSKIKKLLLSDVLNHCRLKGGFDIPTLSQALDILKQTKMMVFLELKDMPTDKTRILIENAFKLYPQRLRIISFKYRFHKFLTQSKSSNINFWNKVKFLKLKVLPVGFKKYEGLNLYLPTYKKKRKKLNRLNKELSVWTVNDEKDLNLLIADKIDFITTDKTDLCLRLK